MTRDGNTVNIALGKIPDTMHYAGYPDILRVVIDNRHHQAEQEHIKYRHKVRTAIHAVE